jgi:hypothetical protein
MSRASGTLLGTLACLALGCAVSRQGTLETLPSGPVIPVTVSVEGDGVLVRGQSPATGETFEGRLMKVSPGRSGGGGWYPSSGGGVTPLPGGIGATASGGTEKTLDVAGNLEGDHGTTLRCVAQVERRLRLSGGGICRVDSAVDNPLTYRLRF